VGIQYLSSMPECNEVQEVRMRGTYKDVGAMSRMSLFTHCWGTQKKGAQLSTVATEYIRRTTRCTSVFSMQAHRIHLTQNQCVQCESMQMHVSEASHAQPTNPRQEMWRWKIGRAQAAKDEPHHHNNFTSKNMAVCNR
jgi:hypothetical protein